MLILVLSISLGARAERVRFTQNPVNHFITLSLGGGEGNTLSGFAIPESKDLAGADGFFGLGYELRKNSFFFGFGVQADFELTRQQLGKFVETENRIDFEKDPHIYSYRYAFYQDAQRNLQLGVPIHFGLYFGDYVYAMLGAKFVMSLWNDHSTVARFSTDGTYPRYSEPITDRLQYGFYPEDTYFYKGEAVQEMKVGPTLEVGVKVPVFSPSRRFGLRIGVYAEYLCPLGFTNQMKLVDYSGVKVKPMTKLTDKDLENLHKNIIFHSFLNSQYQTRAAQNLAVGLKLTFLFNATSVPKLCNCDRDTEIRPIRSAGGQKGHVMK